MKLNRATTLAAIAALMAVSYAAGPAEAGPAETSVAPSKSVAPRAKTKPAVEPVIVAAVNLNLGAELRQRLCDSRNADQHPGTRHVDSGGHGPVVHGAAGRRCGAGLRIAGQPLGPALARGRRQRDHQWPPRGAGWFRGWVAPGS